MSRALSALLVFALSILVAYALFIQLRQGWYSLQFWEIMADEIERSGGADYRIGRFDPAAGEVKTEDGPGLGEIAEKLWIVRSQMAAELAAMLGLLILNAGRFVSQRGYKPPPSAYFSKSLFAALLLIPLPMVHIGVMLIWQARGFDELGVLLMGTPLILTLGYVFSVRWSRGP